MSILLQVPATTVLDTTQAAAQAVPVVTEHLSVLELLTKGGFMMVPLMLALAVAIFFIIERYLFFRKRKLSRAMAKAMHTKILFDNSKIKKAYTIEFAGLDDYIKKVSGTY